MSLTKQQLEALNNNSFPNNTSGYITPEILRNYNDAVIVNTVNQDDYTNDSASFSNRINQGGGNIDTGSFAITGSNTFVGTQTISGSNGKLIYTGTTNTSSVTLAEVHSNDEYPWLERFYNDTFSTTNSVMSYFAWNDGRFIFHNDSTQSIGIGINGDYNAPELLVYTDKVVVKNDLFVSGNIYATNLTGSGGNINTSSLATTGSNNFIGTQTISGSLLVSGSTNFTELTGSLGNFSSSINSRIIAATNEGQFATTGSNNFIGNQTISGSLYVSSSTQKDVIVEGQLWVSSSNLFASGATVQPQINVVGPMPQASFGSRSGSVQIKPASILVQRGNSNTTLYAAGVNSFGPDLGNGLNSSNSAQYTIGAADGVSIDNEINLYADLTGTQFRDYDNTIGDYTAWLTLGPNDGVNIPPVAFQRNVQITGSLSTTAGFGQVELLSNQTIPTGVDTIITFNNDEFDPNGWYNSEFFYYQPTIAGIYQISYSVNFEPATTGTGQINVQIAKDNGTDVNQLAINQHELNLLENTSLTGTVFAQLDGNLDKLYLTAYSSVGQVVNGGNGTYLNIKLL